MKRFLAFSFIFSLIVVINLSTSFASAQSPSPTQTSSPTQGPSPTPPINCRDTGDCANAGACGCFNTLTDGEKYAPICCSCGYYSQSQCYDPNLVCSDQTNTYDLCIKCCTARYYSDDSQISNCDLNCRKAAGSKFLNEPGIGETEKRAPENLIKGP